jgi:type VI secretion system protein ImpA
LRRAPIISHRQLGSYSLRDLELASGQLNPTEADTNPPNTAQIQAALTATPVEELTALASRITAAAGALRNAVATMQNRSGFESTPDFDPLLKSMTRVQKLLDEHLPARAGGVATSVATDSPEALAVIGGVKSRQDAVRAIDAAAAFFRNNEPSSPIPLLLDRAKRLVSKSFLEVLEDIAPETLTEVKRIGGVKSD